MARRFEMISANFTSRASRDFLLMPASRARRRSGLGKVISSEFSWTMRATRSPNAAANSSRPVRVSSSTSWSNAAIRTSMSSPSTDATRSSTSIRWFM